MIRALLTGCLHKPAEARKAASGADYARGVVLVDLDDQTTVYAVVSGFGPACERLLALRPGDALSAAGRLRVGLWKPAEGDPRVSMSMLADEIAAVRAAPRPRRAAR